MNLELWRLRDGPEGVCMQDEEDLRIEERGDYVVPGMK